MHADALDRLAEGIVRNARQVSGAIDGIRNLLGHQGQELAPIDLNDPVQDTILLMRGDLSLGGIALEIDGLEQPHTIEGDRGQLQVMLINLLRNAMAATGPGGRIVIALRTTLFGAELDVDDDGPGFAGGVKAIDDLLLTTDKPEGMGVGLFLVGCAVDNHGATIHLRRSPLGGAGLTIRFPPSTGGRRRGQPVSGRP